MTPFDARKTPQGSHLGMGDLMNLASCRAIKQDGVDAPTGAPSFRKPCARMELIWKYFVTNKVMINEGWCKANLNVNVRMVV